MDVTITLVLTQEVLLHVHASVTTCHFSSQHVSPHFNMQKCALSAPPDLMYISCIYMYILLSIDSTLAVAV